jgi:hypothetical protein
MQRVVRHAARSDRSVRCDVAAIMSTWSTSFVTYWQRIHSMSEGESSLRTDTAIITAFGGVRGTRCAWLPKG